MSKKEHLSSFLRSRLPQGNQIRTYHVSTPPTACSPLFAPASRRSEEATKLESHFLAISQSRLAPGSPDQKYSEVLVLALEVLIFTTNTLTTVFVSKADSTGFLTRSNVQGSRQTPLAQIVITAFLDFLLQQWLHHKRLVLSLFARAQNQYLFPGSIENATKHVLDDRQLIKWWCKVLDPLARGVRTDDLQSVKAHIVVPGCDSGETKAFFPSTSLTDSASNRIWWNNYPVDLLVEDTSLPPRCLVPRLPDDPKSRFLDDLDARANEHGVWPGIKSLEQFWEMMSFRQECSAGRVVGFVWIVFTPVAALKSTSVAVAGGDDLQQTREMVHQEDGWSQSDPKELTDPLLTVSSPDLVAVEGSRSLPLVKPVNVTSLSVRATTIPVGASHADAVSPAKKAVAGDDPPKQPVPEPEETSQLTGLKSFPLEEPEASEKLTLSAEHYQELMDLLLQLDFAGIDVALESSNTWRDKAMALAGVKQFGMDVEGTAAVNDEPVSSSQVVPTPSINLLTGVRKKRKVEQTETDASLRMTDTPAVNVIATSLIRKRPKPLDNGQQRIAGSIATAVEPGQERRG